MDIFNIILGILLVPLGIFFIDLTAKVELKHQSSGYFSKLGVCGIGAIVYGLILIADEIIKII